MSDVRRLVDRQPAITEAMLVTADNHAEVDAWVRSKGDGWHTHGSWKGNGLGVSPDGTGNFTITVDDGEWLLFSESEGAFFAAYGDSVEAHFVDAPPQ